MNSLSFVLKKPKTIGIKKRVNFSEYPFFRSLRLHLCRALTPQMYKKHFKLLTSSSNLKRDLYRKQLNLNSHDIKVWSLYV